ncbi:MAG: hypothetical protein Q4F47_08970 [Bacteroidaceae bacterium]|nr:hypothetical protein [Bacteroidaceae bacterium]MDO5483150.1 hypothetical protein [Bacteroidaceae bacterium]
MKKQFLVAACMALATSFAFAQKSVTVKAGTIVPLQAVKQIKAADVNEGETVDFRVANDIIVDNNIAIQKGTIVKGTVNEAKKSSIAGTKGRLVINISNLILPSGEQIYFSNTAARIYGKNRTPLAVITGIFVWPCIFIPGTKAVMPEGYEIQATVASNTEVKIN